MSRSRNSPYNLSAADPRPVTVPDPVPDLDTVRVYWVRVKAALGDLAAVMDTVQVLLLVESHPVQEAKLEPVLPVAVKVTDVP